MGDCEATATTNREYTSRLGKLWVTWRIVDFRARRSGKGFMFACIWVEKCHRPKSRLFLPFLPPPDHKSPLKVEEAGGKLQIVPEFPGSL